MAFTDRLKSLKGYLTGSETSGKVYRLVIEITNACNLKCAMCPRNNMKRRVEHMGKEIFERIIIENHERLEFVSLNGYGEPLLHPNLFEYLEICRKYKVPTGISTNCTRLKGEMAEKLLTRGPDQLTLAIDGVEKESYEKVRVGAVFDNVLENVKRFLRMREGRKDHAFVILQCIYMTETKSQIHDFYGYFSDYKYDAIRIRQLTHSGGSRTDENYKHSFSPCYWIWTEPMILSNGTVVPCCQDVNGELALGNIREKSLSELWERGYIVNLRRKHANGQRASIPICKDCNMYQPSVFLALAASLLHTSRLNRWLPTVEAVIAFLRYRGMREK